MSYQVSSGPVNPVQEVWRLLAESDTNMKLDIESFDKASERCGVVDVPNFCGGTLYEALQLLADAGEFDLWIKSGVVYIKMRSDDARNTEESE